MRAKKLVLTFFLSAISLAIAFFSTLFIYDPLSLFHMPFAREFTVYANMRLQNAALIRHFNFDSVIIGNSYTANTSAKEASSLFGGKFMNLSMDGANLYDQSIILNHVLERQHIKTVIRLLSEGYGTDGHGNYSLDQWAFLYDNNPLNDFEAYLNLHYLTCLTKWSQSQGCIGKKVNLDTPSAWHEYPDHYSRFGGIDNWILHKDNNQITATLHTTLPEIASIPPQHNPSIPSQTATEIERAINQLIVQPAKKYSTTRFIYFFNPSSLLQYAIAARNGRLAYHLYWQKTVVSMTSNLHNVEIYSFDNEAFTEDIANYKDLAHYTPQINHIILQSIYAAKNRITPENIEAYNHNLQQRAEKYDISALNNYIQEQLNKPTQQP